MNRNAVEVLEYDKIKEMLREYTVSEMGKELVNKLQPSIDINIVENWMRETTETRAIVDRSSGIPIHGLNGIEKVTGKFGKGIVLNPEDFTILLEVLKSTGRIKRFMADKVAVAPTVSSYALSMIELDDLSGEIERCILDNRVDDRASPELSKIRKKIAITEDRIASKLESMLHSAAYKDYIQDPVISMRNGAYVIPVKREHRKNFQGTVLDTSTSGSTVFIEPSAVKELREELYILKIEEEKEVYRILSGLTAMTEAYRREISINIETMAQYDFLFAKGKFSRAIDGSRVSLNAGKFISIKEGRHPLIGKSAVPLDFTIGDSYRALVITGPNTGGKTVALKTVGLLTLMVQSGMHVPASCESEFSIFNDVLVDIGDGQSIEQSLSTFSSHIKNISSIIECADPYTLVIMDELGAGTDPGEGMGLAVAVLEEVYGRGATILATTHYCEIKEFAGKTEGFKNGRMEFDINTLKPLYRLVIGEAGESNAFLIAVRLGISKSIIERAHEVTYKERKDYTGLYNAVTVNPVADNDAREVHIHQIERVKELKETKLRIDRQKIIPAFKHGDCVFISTMNRTGIVCETENSKGEVTVMVMKKKFKVNKKRLSLYVDGKELYPENYDFDIVFESKENRKKRHQMQRKHVDGLIIEMADKE